MNITRLNGVAGLCSLTMMGFALVSIRLCPLSLVSNVPGPGGISRRRVERLSED